MISRDIRDWHIIEWHVTRNVFDVGHSEMLSCGKDCHIMYLTLINVSSSCRLQYMNGLYIKISQWVCCMLSELDKLVLLILLVVFMINHTWSCAELGI